VGGRPKQITGHDTRWDETLHTGRKLEGPGSDITHRQSRGDVVGRYEEEGPGKGPLGRGLVSGGHVQKQPLSGDKLS